MSTKNISLTAQELSRRAAERALDTNPGSEFVVQDLFPNWYQLGTREIRRNAGSAFYARGRVVPGVRAMGKTARGQQIYRRD